MATITFSALPPETHDEIAKFCETGDLHNLCLTSKLMNERFFRALYRHVDRQLNLDCSNFSHDDRNRQMSNAWKTQNRLFHTFLTHPEYGKHVRSLRANVYIPVFSCHQRDTVSDTFSEKEFWRAMQSLTHVQRVDLKSSFSPGTFVPTKDLPNNLFQSVTSVRLAGKMQWGLAKSIISVINPATLKHLCLDLVEEYEPEHPGNPQIYRLLTPSGLLMTLTGRCAALRSLTLRRSGADFEYDGNYTGSWRWPVAREEASYLEWASFIRSVQGTLEDFTFELVKLQVSGDTSPFPELAFMVMDERFLRLILPAIVSGNWPCLTMMTLRGVRTLDSQDGKAALVTQLRAVLGGDTKIVVE